MVGAEKDHIDLARIHIQNRWKMTNFQKIVWCLQRIKTIEIPGWETREVVVMQVGMVEEPYSHSPWCQRIHRFGPAALEAARGMS